MPTMIYLLCAVIGGRECPLGAFSSLDAANDQAKKQDAIDPECKHFVKKIMYFVNEDK